MAIGDPSIPGHAARITLPVCNNEHVITGADGRLRKASRKLKLRSEAGLPPQVGKLLDERFFVELVVYASLRPRSGARSTSGGRLPGLCARQPARHAGNPIDAFAPFG